MASNSGFYAGNGYKNLYGTFYSNAQLIAELLGKSISELEKDFATIDKYYDEQFDTLLDTIKELYSARIKDKQAVRENIIKLIFNASSVDMKEKLLNEWLRINEQINALFIEADNYYKSCQIKKETDAERKKKRTLGLKIAKVVGPCVVMGVAAIGSSVAASKNSTKAIGSSIPKIAKK